MQSVFPLAVPKGRSWKRPFDVCVSTLIITIGAPLLCLLAILVRIKMGSPVLFVTERPGLRGRPFKLVKFRTMRDESTIDGAPLPDAQRITRFGKMLRSTSLDELPELWNVLRGDMSLVGPRPLLVQYMPLYSPEQARRHEVKPGITGWAQVNGRNAISWEQRFALDVWYVDHFDFWLDLRILAMTAWRVVRREGISAPGEVTMSPFTGCK